MKMFISKNCLAVVAIVLTSIAFAGQVDDMDGTTEELLNASDGSKNLVAFGRCGAVIMYVSADIKAKNPASDIQFYDAASKKYVQILHDILGAKTPEQKEQVKNALRNIGNGYQKLYDIPGGRQKILNDYRSCIDFIGSAKE